MIYALQLVRRALGQAAARRASCWSAPRRTPGSCRGPTGTSSTAAGPATHSPRRWSARQRAPRAGGALRRRRGRVGARAQRARRPRAPRRSICTPTATSRRSCTSRRGFTQRPYISQKTVDEDSRIPRMEGKDVFKHAVTKLPKSVLRCCSRAGVKLEDVDSSSPTRPTSASTTRFANRSAVPAEKVPTNIARVGNTSAATIPILYDEIAPRGQSQRRHADLLPRARRRPPLGQRALPRVVVVKREYRAERFSAEAAKARRPRRGLGWSSQLASIDGLSGRRVSLQTRARRYTSSSTTKSPRPPRLRGLRAKSSVVSPLRHALTRVGVIAVLLGRRMTREVGQSGVSTTLSSPWWASTARLQK